MFTSRTGAVSAGRLRSPRHRSRETDEAHPQRQCARAFPSACAVRRQRQLTPSSRRALSSPRRDDRGGPVRLAGPQAKAGAERYNGDRTSTPTRTLFLIDELDIGGTEQQILELVKRLDRSRYLPLVCCFRPGRVAREIEAAGVQVFVLPKRA